MTNNYDLCPPKAEALISSLRAFGYDLSMAIADLIDNSIYAGAKTITIDYDWNAGNPWIRIVDDGKGMAEAHLKEAMRLGSQSPRAVREKDDLGRFGLGLKTASFSQCKILTVRTKIASGNVSTRCWNLDHVIKTDKWELGRHPPRGSEDLLDVLESGKSGTIVLWQSLDRVTGNEVSDDDESKEIFLGRFKQVARYFEMVFHQFLIGKDRIRITVGRHRCQPWDPFLTSNEFTEELSTEYINNRQVRVRPWVLPHVSKRSKKETEEGSGLYGWNAHQGFYVYRNNRIIIAGGYLDFDLKPEEHFKLCRIRIDLPNNLDHEWGIDVRKASASPPSSARNDLERIAKAARAQAVRIYRARTGTTKTGSHRKGSHDVWLRRRRGDKIVYEINRRNEVIKHILEEVKVADSWVRKLFHLIEKTVPHRVIVMDNADVEDCHVDLPPDLARPPDELIKLCRRMFLERVQNGAEPHQAADFICSLFDDHLSYRVMIDELIEEMQ